MQRPLKKIKISFAVRARMLRFLYGRHKRRLAVLVALGFLSGILGGLGIGVVIPLFSFAMRHEATGSDFISRTTSEFFALVGIEPTLISLLVLISGLFVLKAVVMVIFGRVTARISSDYEQETMDRLYRLTFSAGWPFLLHEKIGHLQNLLTVNVQHVSRLMVLLSTGFLNFAQFLVFFAIALKLSWGVTVTAFLFGLATLLASRPMLARSRGYAHARAILNADIAHEVNENMTGMKMIKALGMEEASARRGLEFFRRMNILRIRGFVIKTLNAAAIEPMGIMFVLALFAVLSHHPDFDLGVFAVVMYSIHKIFVYVNHLQDSFHSATSSLQYVRQLISFEERAAQRQEEQGGRMPFRFEKLLELRNVTFLYDERTRPALSAVSFSVRKGEMVGIIGPSGAGKTTITDLLLRLLRPSGGMILVDGVDAEEIALADWRRHLGYVSQDMFLKNDTIANNIKFHDETIDDEKVRHAVLSAHLNELVSRLPQGLQTLVGERGLRLSGGERQRVALARVFARSPKILVLDEATSALDHESEAMIQKAIAGLRGDVTIIAIAHRLSTIMRADRLVIIRDGQTVEEGTPQDLLKDADSYFYKAHEITIV